MKIIIENNKLYVEENNIRAQATVITVAPVKKAKPVKGSNVSQHKAFEVRYALPNGSMQREMFKLEDAAASILGESFTEQQWDLLEKYFFQNESVNVTGQLVNNQLIVKTASTWKNNSKAFTNFADALKYIIKLQQQEDEAIRKMIKK